MVKTTIVGRIIVVVGWLLGFAAATVGDYFMIPKLMAKIGGKPLPIVIGILMGIALMFLFVEGSRRIAGRRVDRPEGENSGKARKGKTPVERLSLSSRIVIAVLAILIAASMVMNGVSLGAFK